MIVGIGPPGVQFFHTGVRRRKYKLGQTKQNPSDGGLWPRGWGLLVTERCVLNHHNRTGSFKMKRFEICSRMAREVYCPRTSLDVSVRAGTKQTTPRGLVATVSGFGGPCTLPLRRSRCDTHAQERSRRSTCGSAPHGCACAHRAGPRLLASPAPIATPSCRGTRCTLHLAQTGPEEV